MHANLIIGASAPTMYHLLNEIRVVIAIDFGPIIVPQPDLNVYI